MWEIILDVRRKIIRRGNSSLDIFPELVDGTEVYGLRVPYYHRRGRY